MSYLENIENRDNFANKQKQTVYPQLSVNRQIINNINEVQCLIMIMDSNSTFESYIEHISKKLAYNCHILNMSSIAASKTFRLCYDFFPSSLLYILLVPGL